MQSAKKNMNDVKSARIKELQEKIHDPEYINSAVDRIALVMSKRILGITTVSGTSRE